MSDMKLLAAIRQLDVKNDAHWTSDGWPRLETLKFISGNSMLTREMVTLAAPGASRSNPLAPADPGTSTSAPPIAAPAAPQLSASQVNANGSEPPPAETQQGLGGLTDSDLSQEQETPADPLRAAYAEAARQLDAAIAAKTKADQEHAKALKVCDTALDALSKSGQHKETLATQVSAYHARQKDILAERAQQRQRLKDANINLADLLPSKAKIDSAFARKNVRGNQRPNNTLKR